MRQHDAASFAFLPPKPQQREELRGKHGVAVLASLALFDPDQHPLAVDVIDLEAGHFGHTQARAIGGPEYGLVLGARRRFEELADFLDAQHRRELARIARQDQAPRQIRPVECRGEEEAQRRHGAVYGGRLHSAFALMNLKPANILGGRRIRRPSKEGSEIANKANIVALRIGSQAAHRHVFEHALAQSADRAFDR